jgi:acyl-CoA thioester hydrolase
MRIKIEFPTQFSFATNIAVLIQHINYANHVGNDSLLGIAQEARMRYIKQWGWGELDIDGTGLIMADSAIVYKGEAFYGDMLLVEICIGNVGRVGFDMFYKVSTTRHDKQIDIAYIKTGMICFDYTQRKVISIPAVLLAKFSV